MLGLIAMVHTLSKNTVFIDVDGQAAAYDRVVGNLAVLTPEQYRLLTRLPHAAETPPEQTDIIEEFRKLGFISSPFSADSKAYIQNQISGVVARPRLIENLNGLLLKVTDGCNFRCSYCIDTACGTVNDSGRMKPSTALRAVALFLDFIARRNCFKNRPVTIGFNGGEPLLHLPLISDCISYARSEHPEIRVDFDINTNLALLTPEIAQFLKCNSFSVTTSLDGLKVANDAQRHSRVRGDSPFALTTRGIQILKEINYSSRLTVIVVVTEQNINKLCRSFLEFIHRELGIERVIIEPDMSRALRIPPFELARIILHIMREADSLPDLSVGGGWSTPFRNLMKANDDATPNYCDALSGFSVNVFPDGDIRACNYLSAAHTLGRVQTLG